MNPQSRKFHADDRLGAKNSGVGGLSGLSQGLHRGAVLIPANYDKPPSEQRQDNREEGNRVGQDAAGNEPAKWSNLLWWAFIIVGGFSGAGIGVALETDDHSGRVAKALGGALGMLGVLALCFGVMGLGLSL